MRTSREVLVGYAGSRDIDFQIVVCQMLSIVRATAYPSYLWQGCLERRAA